MPISTKIFSMWQNWYIFKLRLLFRCRYNTSNKDRKDKYISTSFSKISYLVLYFQRVLVFSQKCIMHDLVCLNKAVQLCKPLVLKANIFHIPLLHDPLGCVISSVILLNYSFVSELVSFQFGEFYVPITAWIIAMS